MCADILNLEKQLRLFEEKGVDYLHIDLMDGVFAANMTFGPGYVEQLRKACGIPFDFHFMVDSPENRLNWFLISAGDYVSVHYESTRHIQKVLQMIRGMGGKPMLALNPGTPVIVLEELADDLDGVLIMTVNPGFAGQKLVPQTICKIAKTRAFLDGMGKTDIEIEVDGNVSFGNAARMSVAGANIFVAGSSSVFSGDIGLNIDQLRNVIAV
jgi:ribulose-phosphate 3-epimerase